MKTKITLLTALVAAFFALNAQQVPNGSFETWTTTTAPDGWTTLDAIIPPIAPSGLSMKDTADKVDGAVSVKLTSTFIALANDTIPGILSLGTGFFNGASPQFYGAPFTYRPDTLFFSYKYTPVGNDTAFLSIAAHKLGGTWVLGGGLQLTGTAGQWYNVFIPLTSNYSDTTGTIDTLEIQFMSSGNQPRAGSILNVDAVSLGYVGGSSPCTAPTSPTSATATSATILQGQSDTLSLTGGSLGNGQWTWYSGSCGGTQVGTGATLTVTPATTTTYFVRGEGCGMVTACAQVTVTVTPVGINEIGNIALNVFPNPASDVLTISADKNISGYTFTVLDVTGRMVNSTTLDGQTSTVNIANLAKGNYIYKIMDGNNQLVQQNKFVVIK